MAGWISSKLKVAENLLQQIDQQAAESLRKNERSGSLDPLDADDGISKRSTSTVSPVVESVPLKLQLNKKPPQSTAPRKYSDQRHDFERNRQGNALVVEQAKSSDLGAAAAAAADGDWTELLGSDPSPSGSAGAFPARQKSVKRRGGGLVLQSEERRNRVRKPSSSWKGTTTPASSGDRQEHDLVGVVNGDKDDGASPNVEIIRVDAALEDVAAAAGSGVVNLKREAEGDGAEIQKLEGRHRTGVVLGSSAWSTTTVESSAPRGSSPSQSDSSGRSDSETDSGSSTDSEKERDRREERRKRRERINAEKAAKAIKERENIVAKLEGEKQSLEKILEERKKQQAQEASELQTTMMETMEAVDLEKQRHNSTRMEALACLAALESTNAELARSLVTTQWNLEVEANRVAEIRQQIEFKKLAQEELRRKLSKFHQSASSLNKLTSEGAEYEAGILKEEDSFICDKIKSLKEKAKKIEENIELTRKEIVEPTEVEVELKGRLEQLTDRLIQKQTQVESLSSEKAMLLFRIETVLKFFDDNGLSSQLGNLTVDSGVESTAGPSVSVDIEGGTWPAFNPTSRTPFPRIRSAEHHLCSFIRQLDSIFSAGALFLRKNPMAQVWSFVYLVCLHFWVIYVLLSHSSSSSSSSSGATLSLETINKTTRP